MKERLSNRINVKDIQEMIHLGRDDDGVKRELYDPLSPHPRVATRVPRYHGNDGRRSCPFLSCKPKKHTKSNEEERRIALN